MTGKVNAWPLKLARKWVARPTPPGTMNGFDGMALSADGKVLVCNEMTLISFDWNGTAWTQRPTITTGKKQTGGGAALSADGTVLVVVYSTATNTQPRGDVYRWTGSAWTLQALPVIGSANGGAILPAISADGMVIARSLNSSPYLVTYAWSGTAWVARPSPATFPAASCLAAALSADGSVLAALASSVSPYIHIWDWNGTAWVKRGNLSPLPPSFLYDVALSGDGSLVAAATYSTSPRVVTYNTSPTGNSKRADPVVVPGGSSNKVALSADGKLLLVASSGSPSLWAYDFTGGAWALRDNQDVPARSGGYYMAISSNGRVLATGTGAAGSVSVFDWR